MMQTTSERFAIAPAARQQIDRLMQIAGDAGLGDMVLRDLLIAYFLNQVETDDRCIVAIHNAMIAGFAYYGFDPITEDSWDLSWIVVAPHLQRRSIGRQLLDYVEVNVLRNGGRQILIETSASPEYEPARQFYSKCGYSLHVVVPDFYAAGDHKAIFRKLVNP